MSEITQFCALCHLQKSIQQKWGRNQVVILIKDSATKMHVNSKITGSGTSDSVCRPLFCDFCKAKCCESEQSCVCDPFNCSLPSVISSPNLISHRLLGSLLLLPARGIGIIMGLLAASIVSKLAIVGLPEDQIQKQVRISTIRGSRSHYCTGRPMSSWTGFC